MSSSNASSGPSGTHSVEQCQQTGSAADGVEEDAIEGIQESPLWKYVEKIEKLNVGGGTYKWKCNFCKETWQGSYSRVKGHLLRIKHKGIQVCNKVTAAQVREMARLEDEFEVAKNASKSKKVPLPSEGPHSGSGSSLQPSTFLKMKKRKGELGSQTIYEAFNLSHRDHLDCLIARMFYTGGLSFNLARNPYYLSAFTYAVNAKLGGYVPPRFNKLRTSLLEQEKAHVESLLEPVKRSWPEKGITIVSDGWSDPQRRPLINFMSVSVGGPMFIKSVNCAGEVKDKRFIMELMKEVTDEVGHQNVVQIITDNASNCKGAGELIEGIYPHIYWTSCIVHTLNLALKNICVARNLERNQETYDACHWITEVHNEVMQIKNFIMNHNMRLTMYLKFTPLKLLSVADTRFAFVVIMLKRFKLIRRALESMVMSDEWSLYKDNDQIKARFVRSTILDEDWWKKLTYIVEFTAPIYDIIRACDTDKPCLHLVYEMWDSMIGKVKKAIYKYEGKDLLVDQSDFYTIVHEILVSRWAKSNTTLHCLAHSLNPRFYSDSWLSEDPTRVPPHRDAEVSAERINCFRRLFPNADQCKQTISEFASFSLKSGPFSYLVAISMMDSEDPRIWWASFGASIPLLQQLAFKLLGQPASSSCCERNWSTYSFIHYLKRNKLTPKHAKDLSFIHNNLRLLSRNSEEYKNPSSKMWDVGGDEFGSMEDTGVLEFAELSLDEPELEEELAK